MGDFDVFDKAVRNSSPSRPVFMALKYVHVMYLHATKVAHSPLERLILYYHQVKL